MLSEDSNYPRPQYSPDKRQRMINRLNMRGGMVRKLGERWALYIDPRLVVTAATQTVVGSDEYGQVSSGSLALRGSPVQMSSVS